jgi:HEPN domain-containing protein
MNRSDLRKLALMRLSDAKALLKTRKNNAGAYYVAGYAVECALKACIAKNQGLYPFPPRLRERELANYYTHNIETLIEVANLKIALDTDCASDPALQANRALVVAWSEQVRYETILSRKQAENLIKAIDDPQNGVLTWLKKHW